MKQDPKDPKQDPEEELKRLMKELEGYKNSKNTSLSFAFLLHRNFVVHLCLSLILNFLMSATVIGITIAFEYEIVQMEIIGFVLAVILLTVMENSVKILLFKYGLKLMIYSLGIVSWIVNLLIWYIASMIVGPGFEFLSLWNLMMYALLFSVMRFIASVYLRRWLYLKNIHILGGKK